MKNRPSIVAETDDYVIVNKPPRFLTLPDRYAHGLNNLYHYLEHEYGKIYTVHRLDKETSGILVFAKTEEMHRDLSRQFQQRTVTKRYLTLVQGRVHERTGTIDKPIGPHPTRKDRMAIVRTGKRSITEWEVVEYFDNYTLLSCEIKTGRTHQIRVHLQSVGYPLAVDPLYSSQQAFMVSSLKGKRYNRGKDEEERPIMDRSILHAHELAFDAGGERVKYQADLPKDFAAVLKQLRKWGQTQKAPV